MLQVKPKYNIYLLIISNRKSIFIKKKWFFKIRFKIPLTITNCIIALKKNLEKVALRAAFIVTLKLNTITKCLRRNCSSTAKNCNKFYKPAKITALSFELGFFFKLKRCCSNFSRIWLFEFVQMTDTSRLTTSSRLFNKIFGITRSKVWDAVSLRDS